MSLSLRLLSLLLFLMPQLTWAYDWEQEEVTQVDREIQVNRNRNYPGGGDEQDLKVQKYLASPSRSPDTVELVKRADAEQDDHSPTE